MRTASKHVIEVYSLVFDFLCLFSQIILIIQFIFCLEKLLIIKASDVCVCACL